jgi:hypothetical protein
MTREVGNRRGRFNCFDAIVVVVVVEETHNQTGTVGRRMCTFESGIWEASRGRGLSV